MGAHKQKYCKSGRHKLEGDNLAYNTNGNRCCRLCRNEKSLVRRRAWRDKFRANGGKFVMGRAVHPNNDNRPSKKDEEMDAKALEWLENNNYKETTQYIRTFERDWGPII